MNPTVAAASASSSSINTKISEITGKSACVAWCPITSAPEIIALGAKDSGGATGFEDTGGGLELYDVSGSSDEEPKLLGSIKTSSRFASVAWTPYTGESNQFPLGVIAGGMSDGVVQIFDPNEIMGTHSDNLGNSLLGTVKQPNEQSNSTSKISVPVTAMQFSPLEPNQLCTGSANGQIAVVDIATAPDLMPTEPGPRTSQSTAEVTAVAWNPVVAHIVATSAGDGAVTVWDLKSHKAWCELRAEHGHAVSDIRWNPSKSSQGLHLLTASSDDRNPVLRIWDLGASTSMPLATLSGHRSGILKTSWCPHDDSLLLSCAKDNRTILWDLYALQPIADIPADSSGKSYQASSAMPAANAASVFGSGGGSAGVGLNEQKHMRYDVLWSPLKRGLVITCSLDKKVQIHSVLALATKSGRPPAWMKPAATVSMGFGGTIVSSFHNPDPSDTRKFVLLRTFQEKPKLVQTSQLLEADLVGSTMIDFCRDQISKNEATENAELWNFMQVIFETNARQKLLEHLGFNAEEIAAAAQNNDLSKELGSLSIDDRDQSGVSLGMSDAVKDTVKRALIVGNFEAAVECCFETGNLADALILASCGGAELWSKAQERFFTLESPKRPFLSMVSGVIRGQLDELVNESNPSDWHETLALLSTYAQADDFPRLCVALGDRLKQAGDEKNASLCFMCALNLERSVEYWKAQLVEATSGRLRQQESICEDDLFALHEFIVKVYVFMQAASSASGELTTEIEEMFTMYAQALADNGLFVTATKYIKGSSEVAKILRDRLYRCRSSQLCFQVLGQAPEFPYQMVPVEQSRGQVVVNPKAKQPEPEAATMNGYGFAQQPREQSSGIPQQQQYAAQQPQAYGGQQESHSAQHPQQMYGSSQQSNQTSVSASVPSTASDQLPHGWVSLQDPNSGMTYYANQSTGETTWEKPQAAVTHTLTRQDSGLDASTRTVGKSKGASLVSKYGDGFVTSASHPELADQYGNVGTSNPYTGSSRPGIARAQTGDKNPPVSGSLNFDSLQLSEYQQAVKDTLLALSASLQAANLNPVEKRQIAEAERSVAVLVKKLARNALSDESVDRVYQMVGALSNRDFATASSIQTNLANSEWRDHKDWLKGIKILITLASKKL